MKLFILFLVLCGAMVQDQGVSAKAWQPFGCHSYLFHSTAQTWAEAQTNCVKLGGYLAVITSKEENNFVKSVAGGLDAWIGFSDAEQEDNWFWANGEGASYTNWCSGEPNNHDIGQHCAITNFLSWKCWDDQQCDRSYPYVCEKN